MVSLKQVASADRIIADALAEHGEGSQAYADLLDVFITTDEAGRTALFLALASRFVGGRPFTQPSPNPETAPPATSAPARSRRTVAQWVRSAFQRQPQRSGS